MKVKGSKRGNSIELLESIDIADEQEVTIEIHGDDDRKKIPRERSGSGEFIHKFRREHDLEKEGIEPEEWLEGIRDRSSGRTEKYQKGK